MGNDLGMQYIMDGNGNYYTVNGSNQLVVAKDRDEAAVFTLFEANQRIGGGKKSKFYQTIPVSDMEENEQKSLENEEVTEQEPLTDVEINDSDVSTIFSLVNEIQDSEPEEEVKHSMETKPQPAFEYSMENIDWKEFINYFLFVSTGTKGYQEDLTKKQSDIDKEICDLLHYVELFDLSDDEGLKAMDMLKDARQRRRDVKDEILRTENFQKMLGTSANVAKAKGMLTELKKLDKRNYFPRQLPGLFDGMDGRATDRDLFRQNRDRLNSDFEEPADDYVYEEEEQS